ncbi:MAG: histone deacetylase [Pseudomonadota bacterium]
MMPLPIVHHPAYVAELPEAHRFPMAKFGRLAAVLREEGIVASSGFHQPTEAPRGWLSLAHDPGYVDQVLAASVDPRIEKEIGFPMEETVARRARLATSGTVLTARLALEYGVACNTAGGSHHARSETGAGFCVFNDVAVAARVLQADGFDAQILIVDLDVHQGDGTAEIFADDPQVVTFSMHAERNYPSLKIPSDIDIGLPDGQSDSDILGCLRRTLPDLFDRVQPGLVFYNAGVDPHRDDRLGRMNMSDEGLFERDRYVLDTARRRGIPVACVIGGGYSKDIDALARRHATIHRAASVFA